MQITIFSFGFKHGLPEADTIWDMRFLPNPYYVPELKEFTGLDGRVSGYVLENTVARDFLKLFEPLLLSYIEKHSAAGRDAMIIAVGCTGGKHRSVAVTEYLRGVLENKLMVFNILHRDIDKE
jgi:UPF0042 nucleotide-binding protein